MGNNNNSSIIAIVIVALKYNIVDRNAGRRYSIVY